MAAVTVDRIELLAIGPDGEKVTWSSHLGAMHQALVVARLFLSNGVEAIAGTTTYTEHEFDRTVFPPRPSWRRSCWDAMRSTSARPMRTCGSATCRWGISRHRSSTSRCMTARRRRQVSRFTECSAHRGMKSVPTRRAHCYRIRSSLRRLLSAAVRTRLSRNQDTSLLRIR